MAENKTQPTKESPTKFVNGISDPVSRKDAKTLIALFKEATGTRPVMWGNIIGFGKYHYKYDSGREGDFWQLVLQCEKVVQQYISCLTMKTIQI